MGWEVPLEKEVAAHCDIPAWEIPWTEELGQLQSLMSQRTGHCSATNEQEPLGKIELT